MSSGTEFAGTLGCRDQDVPEIDQLGDRREVAHRLIADVGIDERVDGQGADRAHHHGVAVGRGGGDQLGRQGAVGAGRGSTMTC